MARHPKPPSKRLVQVIDNLSKRSTYKRNSQHMAALRWKTSDSWGVDLRCRQPHIDSIRPYLPNKLGLVVSHVVRQRFADSTMNGGRRVWVEPARHELLFCKFVSQE